MRFRPDPPLPQSQFIQRCSDATPVPPYADPIGSLSNRVGSLRLPMRYPL